MNVSDASFIRNGDINHFVYTYICTYICMMVERHILNKVFSHRSIQHEGIMSDDVVVNRRAMQTHVAETKFLVTDNFEEWHLVFKSFAMEW